MQNPFAVRKLEYKPSLLLDAVRLLAARTPKTYLVGGFVRDSLLGLEPKDADVEVYGLQTQAVESLLRELFPERVNSVGRSFGIIKVHFDDGYEMDVSVPRRDSKVGQGHAGFVAETDPDMTPAEASRRRDFTINALLADPLTGTVEDYFGGLEDLEHRQLRIVDAERFQDDPLRVYRALHFVARFDLKVEPQTFELMKEMVARGDLTELSRERVTDEIKKLFLKAEKPSLGLEVANQLGIIQKHYPELQILEETEQEHEWHPEGNVWIHTKMVVDEAAKLIRQPERNLNDNEKLQVMLGALCHDLGKPATTSTLLGRIRSRGHEAAGADPTKALFAHWSFATEIQQAAVVSAMEHLKPGMLFREHEKGVLDDEAYINAVRKLIKRIHPVSWRVLLAVAEADWRGRGLPGTKTDVYPYSEKFIQTVIKEGFDKEPVKPLLLGRDLMELGVEPGKRMGEMLSAIESARDRGLIKTREEALEWIKGRLGGR